MERKIITNTAKISIAIAVVLFVLYIVLGYFMPKQVEKIEFPGSGLSDSIFDYQNMTHTAVAGLDKTISLPTMPFTVDVADGVRATVGNASVITKNGFYFLIGEISKGDNLEAYLRSSLTSVIETNADVLASKTSLLNEDAGYINGTTAKYGIYEIVTAGEKKMYISVMRMTVNESIYASDTEIVIGCMSSDYSTQGLANLQGFTDALIHTLQPDKELMKKMGE